MFLIKNAQLRQLAEHGIDRFIDQLLPFIEEEYPEEILLEDPAEVRQRLAALVQKARHYGFVHEQHIASFVLFCMALGDDFDQQPDYKLVVERLTDKTLEPQTRIDQAGELIFDEQPQP